MIESRKINLLAFIVSQLCMVSCLTAQNPDPVPSLQTKPRPTEAERAKKGESRSIEKILEDLQAIEESFAKEKCSEVLNLAQGLLSRLSSEEARQLPLSIRTALSECAARAKPDHPGQAESAVAHLDESLRALTPLWSSFFVQSMKADRLEAAGKREAARGVRESLALQLEADHRLREKNDLALLRLSEEFAELSALEQETLRKLTSHSFGLKRLFETLGQIDAAAASQPTPAYARALRALRDRVVLRIERQYAFESSRLVAAYQKGDSSAVQSIRRQLKQKFPSPSFQKRTDSLIQTFHSQGPMPLNRGPGASAVSEFDQEASPEEKHDQAREALDAGRPDRAVSILKSIPEESRNGRIAQLLNEAQSVHIRELRLRVRDLFNRAQARNLPEDAARDYEQALEILKFILREYPDTQHRRSIERNVRNVERRIEQARRDQ